MMKMNVPKYSIVFLFMLAAWGAKAQMNFQDSSVQVISYWDVGEKHTYTVHLQKLKYIGSDTSVNETVRYEVELSVVDSTEHSYMTRWHYKNFESDSKNQIDKLLASATAGLTLNIQTDEFGAFQSLENWEEVRDHMAQFFDALRRNVDVPTEREYLLQQLQRQYITKSDMEAAGIREVLQFHSFHGGGFILNDLVSGTIQIANLYDNNAPFDTEASVILEAMDAENNSYTLRSLEVVNSEQLTNATYNYLNSLAESLGQEIIEREAYIELKNTLELVSEIHNSGWVLESVQWKEIVMDGGTNLEIRRIELK